MTAIKTGFRGFTVAAIVLCCGCSWFHHKDAAEPAATAAPDAAAELGLASAELGADAKASADANKLATDFYEMRQRLGRTGLPEEGEMKAYRAFVCPPLAAAMDEARVRQKLYIDEHPDDKPPLIEGDLFSSLFEGVDVATPSGTEVTGETARVTMSMRFGEGDSATRWKDVVLLARDQDSWCIADVEYHGDWPFASKGKLTQTLAAPF